MGLAVEQLPGCATDIGAWRNTWITSCTSTAGGRTIQLWNEQSFIDGRRYGQPCNAGQCPNGWFCDRSVATCFQDGGAAAPAHREWRTIAGGAMAISVGSAGPWLVNSSGTIFEQSKPGTLD